MSSSGMGVDHPICKKASLPIIQTRHKERLAEGSRRASSMSAYGRACVILAPHVAHSPLLHRQ